MFCPRKKRKSEGDSADAEAEAEAESEAEAEADAEAAHYGGGHHGNRGLLVQPIPEADPICHLEYEVVTKTHCEVEHR